MSLLADLLTTAFERNRSRRGGPGADAPMEKLTGALIGASDEVSVLTTAGDILDRYAALDDAGRLGFFRHLADDLNIEPARLRKALDAYEAQPARDSYRAYMEASEPPRQELIRRLNMVPGATTTLVRMRADLLRLGRDEDALMALDLDFRHLFASWFNRGFLVLKPISWESPAHILQKIIEYEAVHAIGSWSELRRRLEPEDRRCFAFFHPAMPDEPLIFVEIALTKGIPGSVQALLDSGADPLDPTSADTAVFYSISNCQAGLASISFGNSLIKQVAADLARDLPGLRTFVTLSPIPGLMRWLAAEGLTPDTTDPEAMRRLAARYLLEAKRPNKMPVDPVARFHLGNGAILHQVHGGADTSENGMAQSGGAMVNYLYDLSKFSQNHERFASAGDIAASSAVRSLAAQAAKTNA
ncbi:malonyl-CoA decarboxylase [Roseivivax sp. THAF197b]|uniref:malonyl-CoA decarboxylase n=1 Tax=Roseivivax sp. THAF197b TaxID=2588299 RepID=UPI0012688A64|nr:malonyl-CoA decarboxylase [Roseivivax sp. THAF197b]QFS83261.1 Malonyl-CoA decarboxylase (MCD) [Roseivivax sp. THAF197b]